MESRDTTDATQQDSARVTPVMPVAPLMAAWFLLVAVYVGTGLVPVRSAPVEWARQLVYLAPFIAVPIASFFVYRRTSGSERHLWRTLAVSTLLLATSEAYVSVLVLAGIDDHAGWPMLPVVVTVVAAIALELMLFGLTDFRALSSIVRARHIADAAGFGLLWFGGVLALVMVPLAARYPLAEPAWMLAASAYSVLGMLMILGVAINFAGRSWRRWESWERRVVLAFGVYGLATTLWPAWYTGTTLYPGSMWEVPVEVLWMSGMSLAFAGALTRIRSLPAESRFRAMPRMRPEKHNLIASGIPALYTLGILFFAYAGHTTTGSALIGGAYLVVAGGLTIVVIVRQAASAAENEALFATAVDDPTTGLRGHRYFHERLQIGIDLAVRHGEVLSLVLLDLDEFSRVNNAWGHARGDDVLRQAAIAVKGACRSVDDVCRIGGDEFALILAGSDADSAVVAAERVREGLATVACPDGRPLTASVGIAVFPKDADGREDLLRKADGAVYWAKYHGRNRVVVFDESVVESLSAEDRMARLAHDSHLSTVRALAAAVDARDPHTHFHSRNVAMLAVFLARELKLADNHVRMVEIAALMHDIGMIGTPGAAISRKGPLLPNEMRTVREHPGLGETILSSVQLEDILPWVRHHHEWFDGSGYPDGLSGELIPFESRLIALCDAYDAMTSGRSYRPAMSSTAAIQEIDLGIGTQFDPAIAEAFIRMVGRRKLLRPETRFHRDQTSQVTAG